MKKLITSTLLSLVLLTGMTYSPKSKAVIGAIAASPATAIVGGVVIAGGGYMAISPRSASDLIFGKKSYDRQSNRLLTWLLSAPTIALGILLLDEDTNDVDYKELTPEGAKKLGLTGDDGQKKLDTYNSHSQLKMLNYAAEEVGALRIEEAKRVLENCDENAENCNEEGLQEVSKEFEPQINAAMEGIHPETQEVLSKVLNQPTGEAK